MQHTLLGSTGISVGRTGFGCIPIQRLSEDDAVSLLRRAFEGGITLFDTANAYTNSEERVGKAFSGIRENVVIATKSMPLSPERLMLNIDNSLKMLRTDYIDIFQIHNPSFLPVPGGDDGAYDTMAKAKQQGKLRHIGISNHRMDIAVQAVKSGLYETLQFPLSSLSTEEDMALSALCAEHNVGLIAMKAMSGGLLSNARAAFAFLRRYENIVPIWGIQKIEELEEFLGYEQNPPELDGELLKSIEADRAELGTSFCRGCGYCLPCPAGIPINTAARISFMINRSLPELYFTDAWRANMDKINNCTDCGYCRAHCPYSLDPSSMVKAQLIEYDKLYLRYKG